MIKVLNMSQQGLLLELIRAILRPGLCVTGTWILNREIHDTLKCTDDDIRNQSHYHYPFFLAEPRLGQRVVLNLNRMYSMSPRLSYCLVAPRFRFLAIYLSRSAITLVTKSEVDIPLVL